MKKFFALFSGLLALGVQAQVSTDPAEFGPMDQLKVIVDISLLDQSLAHVQELVAAADAGEDLYFWTWSPFEFPAGHPKANGIGGQAWKNSNDSLVMTKEGPNVYSFTFKPSIAEWYEVDAATVYANDIKFLIKPKDGGGYGDPDRKSPDLEVKVDPPAVDVPPVFAFPGTPYANDIVVINYENFREEKTSMQNLDASDCYVYAECTANGVVYKVENFFQVGSNPKLQMDYLGDGKFRKIIIPQLFFDMVPAGDAITSMKFVVMRKVFSGGNDRVDDDLIIDLECN